MVQLIFNISTEKYNEFKRGFLAKKPVPLRIITDENGNTILNDDGLPVQETEPVMSEAAWIKKCAKEYYMDMYKEGIELLARQAVEIDNKLFD